MCIMTAAIIIAIIVIALLIAICEFFLRFALSTKVHNMAVPADSVFLGEENRRETTLSRAFLEEECSQVTITSRDGLALHGYLHEKPGCDRYVITVHGYKGSALDNGILYRYLAKMGMNVLAIDVRGHGHSGGRYLSMGLWESDDLARWVEFIKGRNDKAAIALHGVSMGGATVMMLSSRNPDGVKAIVEDCGYSSTYDEFACQMKAMFHLPAHPLLDLISLWCRIRLGFSFRDVTPKKEVAKTRIPMMFIHGDADTFVPFHMVHENVDAHRKEHELWVTAGVAHGASMIACMDEYRSRVLRFIERHLEE